MSKRPCAVCKHKPARKLPTRIGYQNAAADPVFCSVRCAADWGLLQAAVSGENDLFWCDEHGWQEGWTAYDGCGECAMTPQPQE